MSRSQVSIARAAYLTRWVVIAILVISVAFQVASLFPDQTHIRFHRQGLAGPVGQAINIAHSLLMIFALVQLILLLKELESHAFFSLGVTRRLKTFALLTLLAIFTGALLGPALSLLFTECQPGAYCSRRFPIDMRALWSMVISLVFYLVARLLDEARRIDEDNRQII